MRRMLSRGIVAVALTAAVVGTAAGCSSNNTEACTNIAQDMKDISSDAMKHVDDPEAMAQSYRDGAAKIRKDADGADGDVKDAADKAATAVENMADQVSQLSTSPDTHSLIDAGHELKAACD